VKGQSFDGRGRVPNDFKETIFISRTALDVRYGLTDDWTGSVTFTYPHFTYRLKPPGGERIEQHFRGPGDTFVSLGRQIVFGERPMTAHAEMPPEIPGLPPIPMEEPATRPVFLSLWAGLGIPTGDTKKPNPAIVTQDVSVANLQTGTGTWDPFFRARVEWPQSGWTPFAEAAVRFPFYENRYDYQTADTEAVVVGVDVPVVPKFSVSLSTLFQRVGRDQFKGDDVGVGGARWIYVVPAASFQITPAVSIDAGIRITVYRDTDTKLSDSSHILQAGLTWRF
jgi:hypothetical protein